MINVKRDTRVSWPEDEKSTRNCVNCIVFERTRKLAATCRCKAGHKLRKQGPIGFGQLIASAKFIGIDCAKCFDFEANS